MPKSSDDLHNFWAWAYDQQTVQLGCLVSVTTVTSHLFLKCAYCYDMFVSQNEILQYCVYILVCYKQGIALMYLFEYVIYQTSMILLIIGTKQVKKLFGWFPFHSSNRLVVCIN